MNQTSTLTTALTTLLSELANGGTEDASYVLNPGDPGILRSLDRLSVEQASRTPTGGGASIAAHVDHLCYGFELLNRYAAGEQEVFETADYSRSWARGAVSEQEWRELRARLADSIGKWSRAITMLDPSLQLHVTGAMSSIVHLAYHLGAIRQIDRAAAGPEAPIGQ